jgi:hypothetical protein
MRSFIQSASSAGGPGFVPTLMVVMISLAPAARSATFAKPVIVSVAHPSRPVVADYDADGRPDLAVSSGLGVGDGLTIWHNTVAGWVQSGSAPEYLTQSKRFVRSAGDAGTVDLMYAWTNVSTQIGSVGAVQNPGNGTFPDVPHLSDGVGGYCRQMFGPVLLQTPPGPGYKLLVAADLRQVPGHTSNGGIYYLKLPLSPLNTPLFESSTYAVNNVVSADFNLDGLPDLAYVGIEPGAPDVFHLMIRLRASTTNWGVEVNHVVQSCYGPGFFALDLNGDAHADLALEAGNDVGIVLNNGSGAFGSETIVPAPAGAGITSFAMGDLNGDGRPDLVQMGYVAGSGAAFSSFGFWVRLNNGSGSFGPPTHYPIALNYTLHGGSFDLEGAIADFDRDGRNDLALTDLDGDRIMIFSGRGDGTFAPPIASVDLGSDRANALALGDLDGDGLRDLAIGLTSASGSVAVMRSQGSGDFDPIVRYDGGATVSHVALGDVTHDGYPDVVLGRAGLPPAYMPGGFGAALSPVVALDALDNGSGAARITGIAAGDLNGDAYADIVCTVKLGTGPHVEVRVSDGIGGLSAHSDYGLSGIGQAEGVALAPETSIAREDIVSFTDGSSGTAIGAVQVLSSLGTGSFDYPPLESPASFQPAVGSPHPFAIISGPPISRTGDLVVLDGVASQFHILDTNFDGTFTEVVSYSLFGTPGVAVATGDVNHDGYTDIAVACPGEGGIALYLGDAVLDYLAPEFYDVPDAVDVQIADVSGDGIDDLVVLTSSVPPGPAPPPQRRSSAGTETAGRAVLAAQRSGASGATRVAATGSALLTFPGQTAPAPVLGLTPRFPARTGAGVALAISPNPSHASARFEFTLPQAGPVRLTIYDVRGRLVTSLANGIMPVGLHHLEWSGRGARGDVAPGVYFARLETAAGNRVQRIVRLR